MIYQFPTKLFTAAAVVLSLAACSSSSKSPSLSSQAVDGFIVGADVYCDGVLSGVTQTAGRFSCPRGTVLSRIVGGFDVGFDTTATTGTPFTGVLTAPATEPFVTPMTTLSVAIASEDLADGETLDLTRFRQARTTLATSLGIAEDTLFGDPSGNLETVKANAQINQVLAAFAQSNDAYEEAATAFAGVLKERADSNAGPISLTSEVEVLLPAINAKFAPGSRLFKPIAELNTTVAKVNEANRAISELSSRDLVAEVSKEALIKLAPVTIARSRASVTLSNDALRASETLTLTEFESDTQVGGMYNATFYSGVTSFEYDSDVFEINENVVNAGVSMAFEIKSVNNDQRSLSFFSDDVVVSATKDRSDSLVVTMNSDDAVFSARATDTAGTATLATVETDGETLKTDGSTFTIDLVKINEQLEDLGFMDSVLSSNGDYQVTLVITGLRINERMGADTMQAEQYMIESGEMSLKGVGFRGYMSIRL